MAAVPIQQAFEIAVQHHKAGRLGDAEALYRQILAVQPLHADALHMLGMIAHHAGRDELAVEWIGQAIQLVPGNAFAHSNLGEAYRGLKRGNEAISSYRKAIELKPECPEFHQNLGVALAEVGVIEEAIGAFGRAVELRPNYVEARVNLGSALATKGRPEEAVAEFRHALALDPNYAEAHYNLGNALRDSSNFDLAADEYRRALALKPKHAQAYNSLGNLLMGRGRLDEAMAEYRSAIEVEPDYAVAYNNLGHALKEQGRLDEAVSQFRHALQLRPGADEVHSNLIYSLLFQEGDMKAVIAEEQHRWHERFAEPVKASIRPHGNDRSPERRLRIGYVSPDLREHVVGRNLRPLFLKHDRAKFEIICYSGVARDDGLTEELRGCADLWRSTMGLGDEAMATLIREDGIDILVDLTQHLAGNRLPVFARQPAPVQVSFAGYPASTGLAAIGYRLSDRYLETGASGFPSRETALRPDKSEMADAAEIEDPTREQVMLIESFWCYDPCGVKVEVGDVPAKGSGRVTFGSLNAFCKINNAVLRLWAQVLRAVAGSRLLLLSPEGSHRERTWKFLEREGVARERVEILEPRPRKEYLALYGRVDIALDPFPYGGHTTSLDALWMGVPVVSLAGQTSVSRGGVSILSNLRLPELVARSEAEYVQIAAELAGNMARLVELRTTLRSRMEASVLMDAPRFARNVEAAYRAMWRQWCHQQSTNLPT